MWCPEARGECVKEQCIDWYKEDCLRRTVMIINMERSNMFVDVMQDMKASMTQQSVLMDMLFDDIENSSAPESVKNYIRQYRNSETAQKLIKEFEDGE